MNKQVFYQQDNADKYFLSPYTDVIKLSASKVILRRRDTKKNVVLTVSDEKSLKNILNILKNGIQNEDIIDIFGKFSLFELLLRNGVIE
mgnify:CR=1 FL=1